MTRTTATDAAPPLPPEADYFPLADGQYRVRPDLHPLGHDFGNGAADRRILQLDRCFDDYRRQKNACRAENLQKYVCASELSGSELRALTDLLLRLMQDEYPDWFHYRREADGSRLQCRASGDVLLLDRDHALREMIPGPADGPVARDILDALACQLQEDLALVSGRDGGRLHWLHLCFPNRWAATDKIGRDFVTVHEPVPGMSAINARRPQLLQAMIHKGPFVRFAWGITTSPQLNLHPQGGAVIARPPAKPPWYLRIERQTVYGLPEVNCSLFLIRTYIRHLGDIRGNRPRAAALAAALASMPEDAQRYKGLHELCPQILTWLQETSD